jgi:hypothetical protein
MARFDLNLKYLKSLTNENLLRNFYLQAGLWAYHGGPSTTFEKNEAEHGPSSWHWGWESPTSALRGHFLGHWLSAAAKVYAQTGDEELRAKTARIVRELARCQEANGGEWAAAIPEVFFHRIAEGKKVWAPHYTVHKLFMGLYDVYRFMNMEEALQISDRFANWFYRWTNSFTREQMDFILDYETGGMLEAWANLYEITKKPEHKELIYRYDRPRFFDALLRGEDVLTNKHANTQIPEILGAARAWETTGDKRWKDIVEAFWHAAVETRGTYCTGGVSCGEVWTPVQQLSARLGAAQEHCVVYNMMRLSQVLYRWTGEVKYADFWERNLLNGVLAQQNKRTGMISYFLEMEPGSTKKWGDPTNHFWCCHGTLVQAHASYVDAIFYKNKGGVVVSQYIPCEANCNVGGAGIRLRLSHNPQLGSGPFYLSHEEGSQQIQYVHIPQISASRPQCYVFGLDIDCGEPAEFELKLRVPWWVNGSPLIRVNGETVACNENSSYVSIRKTWHHDKVTMEFPKKVTAVPLPGQSDMVAFMDGPLVLAGLVAEERTLIGDASHPEKLLVPHNERHHGYWRDGWYKTVKQDVNIRFIPLLDVTDEPYTIYFPIRDAKENG